MLNLGIWEHWGALGQNHLWPGQAPYILKQNREKKKMQKFCQSLLIGLTVSALSTSSWGSFSKDLEAIDKAIAVRQQNITESQCMGLTPQSVSLVTGEDALECVITQNNDTLEPLLPGTSETHLALNKPGWHFIVTKDPENPLANLFYTRLGDFTETKEGYLKNTGQFFLMGWHVDTDDFTGDTLTLVNTRTITSTQGDDGSVIPYVANCVSEEGTLLSIFENSGRKQTFSIPVATFPAVNHLKREAGSAFSATEASGEATLRRAHDEGGSAKIMSGFLNGNPTDITEENSHLEELRALKDALNTCSQE